jgi:hypothetical protein
MSLVMPNGSPQPAQQGTYQNAHNQLTQAYQTYLGRDPEEGGINSHLGGGRNYQQKNVDHAVNQIANSPEAQAYRNRQQSAPAPTNTNTPPPPTQDAPPPPTGGGGPAAPGVPQIYSGPNLQQLMSTAGQNAPSISSNYQAQQIRDFQGKELNIPQYQQTTFNQFSDPRNMQVQGLRDQNLVNLLQNPHSLSQTWQDQMFEQQKDDALAFAQQAGVQNQQNVAGRGLSFLGGTAQGREADIQNNLFSQLLSGRRDVATRAATQNRADELNALGAAEQGLSGDTSRLSQIFQNILAGQGAQAGENQFAAKYGFDSTTALADNERQNYGSYLSGRGLQGTENARQEQLRQSAFGLSQQARQAAEQNALNAFLGGNNADLGWAQYGLSADDQFLRYLSGQGN